MIEQENEDLVGNGLISAAEMHVENARLTQAILQAALESLHSLGICVFTDKAFPLLSMSAILPI